MTKPINEYTVDELSKKIEAIKAEREKTANALKRYEEELERKKQEVPLGVPFTPTIADGKCWWLDFGGNPIHNFFNDRNFDHQVISQCGYFKSYESAKKHAEMLLVWRMALVAIVKGEPINIEVLLPLLPKGKVFFSTNLHLWVWTKEEPKKGKIGWICRYSTPLSPFNIKSADNWEESLMECGV